MQQGHASSLTFIIGGARSGKSGYAERLAMQEQQAVLYVATGQGLDDEMQRRIAAHRQGRAADWQTLELSAHVGRHLRDEPPKAGVLILDCLTLLVSNVMLQAAGDVDHPDEAAARAAVEGEITDLLGAIEAIPARWLVVSNEVGEGLVPPYPAGRLFRDLLGWANQRMAEKAEEVFWMVAGIPVPIARYRQ
jgi:adenosylcobinamide kinase/adenosylcobinamide-phosphate guanylyltransferase